MKKSLWIQVSLALIVLGAGPLWAAAPDFSLVPEGERGLKASVMGLDPADGDYFGLPKFEGPVAKAHGWDKQCFWIDFELAHGKLLNFLPPQTKIYVGIPDLDQACCWSKTRDDFVDYLKTRAAWAPQRIQAQVAFFKVHDPLIWTQDFSFQVGLGPHAQRLFHVGPEDASVYRRFTEDLVRQYPEKFYAKPLPTGISGEGGDMALGRKKDGQVVLVIGRHRVKHYFEALGRPWGPDQQVSASDLDAIQKAYADAYGASVIICPRRPLLEGWGTDELFHLDMVASFLSGPQPSVVVPEMASTARDRSSGQPLDAAFIKLCQREYRAVAEELADDGFKVLRAPLADHPARSPANAVKYRSQSQGRREVFLAHYAPVSSDGQDCGLHGALDRLNGVAADIHSHPSSDQVKDMDQAIRDVWATMALCDKGEDKTFEGQAAAYREGGYTVVPVPDYPWGAGSLHCQFMH